MRDYTFVDYATQGYVVLVGLLILFFHGNVVAHWQLLLAAHFLAVVLIQLLILWSRRQPEFKVLDFIRHFYPVLLYAGFFAETGWLNQMIIKGYLDPEVIHWDQALFGCQPSLALMEKLPFLLISEILYVAYFSYYLMIGGVGIALYFRNRSAFFHYVSVVSFVFYICYLIYIFVPVIGPPIFFRTIEGYTLPAELQQVIPPSGYPEAIKSGIFYQLMTWIYKVFEAPGAAIPSSHVAVALCTVFFSFRYIPSIRWPHLVMVVLLCISTVYCRYHYVCDVLAGIITAVLLIPTGNWLYARFEPGNAHAAHSANPETRKKSFQSQGQAANKTKSS